MLNVFADECAENKCLVYLQDHISSATNHTLKRKGIRALLLGTMLLFLQHLSYLFLNRVLVTLVMLCSSLTLRLHLLSKEMLVHQPWSLSVSLGLFLPLLLFLLLLKAISYSFSSLDQIQLRNSFSICCHVGLHSAGI